MEIGIASYLKKIITGYRQKCLCCSKMRPEEFNRFGFNDENQQACNHSLQG